MSDFAAFPKRKSTWVILGIGAGAAAIAYPFDDEINESLQDADALDKFFTPGKWLGYAWVQGGAAVGLYVVGRYFMEPVTGTHTNKVSHLGFDLLRANLVTQALTYGMKVSFRRDRPTGECCSFPSGHASMTFATAAVLERHFGYRASWPMFASRRLRLSEPPHRQPSFPERRALWIGPWHGGRLDRGGPPRVDRTSRSSRCPRAEALHCPARGRSIRIHNLPHSKVE